MGATKPKFHGGSRVKVVDPRMKNILPTFEGYLLCYASIGFTKKKGKNSYCTPMIFALSVILSTLTLSTRYEGCC